MNQMKVLILNGSPRPDGDTAYILDVLKSRLPAGAEVRTLDTYRLDIRPRAGRDGRDLAGRL